MYKDETHDIAETEFEASKDGGKWVNTAEFCTKKIYKVGMKTSETESETFGGPYYMYGGMSRLTSTYERISVPNLTKV